MRYYIIDNTKKEIIGFTNRVNNLTISKIAIFCCMNNLLWIPSDNVKLKGRIIRYFSSGGNKDFILNDALLRKLNEVTYETIRI